MGEDDEIGKLESHVEQSSYIIQGQDDYKVQLLRSCVRQLEAAGTGSDLSVFCSDGVCWTSKLIVSAASSTLKTALSEIGDTQESCLILPHVTKADFSAFHAALSAPLVSTEQS